MLLTYEKQSGRDGDGHFCKPGDPREIVADFGG
jgi:hypothetical protein